MLVSYDCTCVYVRDIYPYERTAVYAKNYFVRSAGGSWAVRYKTRYFKTVNVQLDMQNNVPRDAKG